ncbi:F-box domain-containing protein [Mycena indigotica]|uniref:F-box domain-containing protein n=1 Tax=Mycena indigotica TaxID=2126181 RepID=A0A8H6SDV5_9AGAR|nr:F-box domain-containing protein [Mycena indigotica]KAF7297142.1 F-box domain-containing protein [Mycena indigotica]
MHLPDEIIAEILGPALRVPDELFSDTSPNSPFSKYRTSTSAYLLVCQSWLRVSTPLLYNTVIVRSKAQADALSRVFKKHPEFGLFVKQLRVEGGYGVAMQHILQATTRLADLLLCFHIWSGDTVIGLTRSLPLVNPRRFILFDMFLYGVRTRQSQALVNAVTECMKEKWNRLTVFEFPEAAIDGSPLLLPFADTLKEVSSLEKVVIPMERFFGTEPQEYILTVAQNMSLKRIEFKAANTKENRALLKSNPEFMGHPGLRGLLKLPEAEELEDDAGITAGPLLCFNTELVPDTVWQEIIDCALMVNLRAPDFQARQAYMGIVLACKRFARLSQPILHDTVVISDKFDLSDLENHILRDPSLASAVWALHFTLDYDTPFPRQLYRKLGPALISGIHITVPSLKALARHFGCSLREIAKMKIAKSQELVPFDVFSDMRDLRWLGLSSRASFATDSINASALAHLHTLNLLDVDATALDVFCVTDLPNLRNFTFSTQVKKDIIPANEAAVRFLQKHGKKIEDLDIHYLCVNSCPLLDLCPRLESLIVVCGKNIPIINCLATRRTHILQKIGFDVEYQASASKKWSSLLRALEVDKLTSLEGIMIPTIQWPTNEHDISKSIGWESGWMEEEAWGSKK